MIQNVVMKPMLHGEWFMDKTTYEDFVKTHSGRRVPVKISGLPGPIGYLENAYMNGANLVLEISTPETIKKTSAKFHIRDGKIVCSSCGSRTCSCNALRVLRQIRVGHINLVSPCPSKRRKISALSREINSSIRGHGKCTKKTKERIRRWNVLLEEYSKECGEDEKQDGEVESIDRRIESIFENISGGLM